MKTGVGIRCQKTTKDGKVQCSGGDGHDGGCFLGGVLLADFDRSSEELSARDALRAQLAEANATAQSNAELASAWAMRWAKLREYARQHSSHTHAMMTVIEGADSIPALADLSQVKPR